MGRRARIKEWTIVLVLVWLTPCSAQGPEAVQNLTAETENVQLNVIFTWNNSPSAEEYNITVTKDENEVDSATVTPANWEGVTGLMDGETYNVSVTAINGTGASAPTTTKFLTAPPTPTNVTIIRVNRTTCNVSWSVSKSATSYEVKVFEQNNTSGSLTEVASYTTTSTNQLITGLSVGTIYIIKIRARNEGGWSLPSVDVIKKNCTLDSDCDENENCNGTNMCVCNTGFIDIGGNCTAQCTSQPTVTNGAVDGVCDVPKPVGGTCNVQCNAGFYLSGGVSVTCVDDDSADAVGNWNTSGTSCLAQCTSQPTITNGAVDGVCDVPKPVGGTCNVQCDAGYHLSGGVSVPCVDDDGADAVGNWDTSGTSCLDTNECSEGLASCDGNADCSNTIGSFACKCRDGYKGSGEACKDIDECHIDVNTHLCADTGTCLNKPGGYDCSCNSGYEGGVGGPCNDIDECPTGDNTHLCAETGTCANKDGGYNCTCNSGYEGGIGGPCNDTDECASVAENNCHGDADCTNNVGSYTCSCHPGYSGDGVNCNDTDECASVADNNCHGDADCTNNVGSYTCSCHPGYSGDGVNCNDTDECASAADNNCHGDADCTNNVGSYTCACHPGYSGDGVNCNEILRTPVIVSVTSTTFIVRINPRGPYQEFEYTLSDDTGVVQQPKTNETTYKFSVLTPGTSYNVTVRITILADGTNVNVTSSDALTVTTIGTEIVVKVVFSALTFTNDLLDRNSEAFKDMSAFFILKVKGGFSGEIDFTIAMFFYGSVGALGTITSKNPSFDINDTMIANATIENATNTASPPNNLTTTEITSSGFTATWDTVTNATAYILEVSCNGESQIYNIDIPPAVALGLAPNTACATTVRAAFGDFTVTAKSDEISFSTLVQVETIEVTALGFQTVSVKFSIVSEATNYKITFNDTKPTMGTADSIESSDGHITKEFVLTTGATYEVSVVPVVGGIDGVAKSATITLVSTVSGLKVYNITKDGFDVVYDAVTLQGNTLVSYVIKYDNGSGQQIAETNETRLHIPSQPLKKDYNITVAYNTTKEISEDSESVNTGVYTVENIAVDSFDIKWVLPPGLSSATFTSSKSPAPSDVLTNHELSRSFTGLSGGTLYVIEVQAIIPQVSSSSVKFFKFSQITVPNPLEGLSCIPVDKNCFSVSWNAVTPIEHYNVWTSPDIGDVVVNGTLPGAKVCGATTGNLYNVSANATNSAGSGEPTTVMGCHTVLASATGITISIDNQTCFTVGWNAIASATSYKATLSNSDSMDSHSAMTSNVSVQICGLHPGTEYSATVWVTYEAGDSDNSTDIVTRMTAPSAPILTFQSATTTSVTISWNSISTATIYHILATGPDSFTATESTSNTNITITGLQPGTLYTFVVQSENSGGDSTDSATLTQITVPEAVKNLTADTENVQLNVTFAWNATTGSKEYVTSVTKDGVEVSNGTVTDTSWDGVTGLNHGETYNIIVKAITDATDVTQESAPTTNSFQTAPPTPTSVSVSSISTSRFTVSWGASKSATLYEVKVLEHQKKGSDGIEKASHDTSSENQLIEGLKAGTVYKIKIRARNAGGWSLQSDEFLQITKPNATGNLAVVKPVAQREFTVNWDPVTGAETYEVSVNGGTPQTVTDTTATFNDQSPGIEYTVSIVAKTSETDFGEQQTSDSTEVTFKTAPPDPGTPVVVSRTTTSITVEWAASTGADSYIIKVVVDEETEVYSETTTINSHEITGLMSGTCYTVHVKATNECGNSSTASGRELCTQTDSPDFTVTGKTNSTITIDWDPVTGAVGYLVKMEKISTDMSVDLKPIFFTNSRAELPGVEPGLEPGTEYKITIHTAGQWTELNSEEVSKNQFTLPAVVSNLACTPTCETCFSVSWDTVLSAISYTADVTGETGLSVDVNNTLPGAEVCDVTTGSLYDVSVFATNEAGNGSTGTVNGCYSVLSVPTNINIQVDSQTCFAIEWDEIVEATSYTVRLTSDTAAAKQVTPMSNSTQLCALQAATVYRASVSATYEAGDSEFSTEDVSQITAPVAPTLKFATATNDSITLLWDASDTATSYHVEISRVDPPSTDQATTQAVSETNLMIQDLTPGFVYSFLAYSENAGGRSLTSAAFEQITAPNDVQDLDVSTENVQKNVEFSWSFSVGASSYNLTVTQGGIQIQQESVTGRTWTGINVTNINDGESYNITVIAVTDARTVSLSSAPVTKEFLTAPPTPTHVGIESIMTGEFEVTWTVSESATLYEIKVVERNANGSDGATRTENSNMLSKVITGLSAGTVYKVRVRARNDGGWSLESSEVIQITVPDAVTNLNVTRPVPQTSFRLLWNEVKGAASYNISVMGGTSPQTDLVGGPTAEFTSQIPGAEYTVSVVARTSTTEFGTQQMSAATEFVFKTAPENASAPTAITKAATSLTFRWTASAGADYYEVKAIDSDGATVREKNAADANTELDGIMSATCYFIQITAVNSFGSSADISGEICTRPASPDFSISSVTTDSILLNWTEQSGVFGYILEVKRTSDGELVTLSITMPIRGTEAHITGLEAGIIYNVSLYSVGIRDNSDKMTKTQITVCAPPEVTLSKRTTDTLGYTWNAVTGADSYLVIYSTGSVSKEAAVTDASYDITGLDAGTVYSVIIRSVNSAGFSNTNLTHTTVNSTGPVVTISGVTASGFQVSYTDVQERENFVIQINPGGISVTTTMLNETISSLSPGTTYTVVVIVNYQTVGQSAGSTPINITTLTEAAPNFTVASNTQNEGIRLSWGLSPGAISYRITFNRSDGESETINFTSSPGLIPTVLGLCYNFTLVTINAGGVAGGVSILYNVQAAPVKVFIFEVKLISIFIFTIDLRDKASATFISLMEKILNILILTLSNVNGFVQIIIVEFLQSSQCVVVRFIVIINDPATNVDVIMIAYNESTENKTVFSTLPSTNLNECLNVSSVCHADADCTDTNDSYSCTCKTGYTGDGEVCENINECDVGSSNCHSDRDCTDTIGNYECNCKTGYTGTSCVGGQDCTACVNVNECNNGENNCNVNAVCTDTNGSFICTCKTNYTGDGINCTSVQCNSLPSYPNANVIEECKVPMTLGGTCQMECFQCHYWIHTRGTIVSVTCVNLYGVATWSPLGIFCVPKTCPLPIWIINGSAPGCEGDKNIGDTCAIECNTGFSRTGSTTATCEYDEDADTKGSWNIGDIKCLDINECDFEFDNTCSQSPKGICTNTPGSYKCSCAEEYAGNGRNCQKKVKLEPMRLVKVTQTTATLEIVSPRRHQSYEIKLLNADGDVVKQFVQSDSAVVFKDLTGDTEYQAQVRIAVLQNGVSVSLDFTEPTTFRTERKTQKGQIQIPEEFIPEHADTESHATQIVKQTIVRIFINENGLRSYQFVKILRIFRGSIIVVIEVTTNGTTNETLTDAEITNPNITVTEVSVGVDPAPGNVAVTEITTSSFRISFDPVPMAILYQITVDYGNRTEKFTNETSLLVDGLPSNTLIVASVTAFIQEGEQIRISNSSDDILFKTASEGPANLVITVLSGNYIIVQFDAVYTAETYYVMFKDGPSFDFTLSADDEADGVLRERVQGLTADVSYTISVVANVGGLNSTDSTATVETGPETVSGVRIYNVNGDGFHVEYDPVNIVPAINTSYVIKYTWDSGNQEETTRETDLRISASPLVTNYMVSVAYMTSMKSSYSTPVSTKIWDLGNVTSTGFDFSWNQYKAATTYSVSLSPGSPENVSDRSISLTDLSSGTEYIIEVSTDGKVLFTITQLTCPSAVANLGCVPKSLECITVNFDLALSATSYDISVPEHSGATITVNATHSTAEICGLAFGTNYTVNAKAINSVCESDMVSVSNCVTATMCTTAPSITNGAASKCDGNKVIGQICDLVCDIGYNMFGRGTATCEDDGDGDGEGIWNNEDSECRDIDECTDETDNCSDNAVCTNNIGSFTCACKSGYSGDGVTCDDFDECAAGTDNCHDDATCTNKDGLFTCACKPGYTGDGVATCKETNECAEGLSSCDGNADCTNTIGSYECTCQDGYEGPGQTCTDIDECTTGADDCLNNATCTNNAGSFTCACHSGYSGDGVATCNDIDECTAGADDCHDNATCMNNVGSFTCACNPGYFGNGVTCQVRKEIVVRIVFSNLTFNDDLRNTSSEEYAKTSATIIQRVQVSLPGNSTFKILLYFPGSVVVLGSIESTNPGFTIDGASIAGATITEALSSVSPPDNLATTSITSNGFTATWSTVSGASQYILEVSCNGESQIYTVNDTQAVASGLQPNTVCEITVRAVLNATSLEATAKSTSVSLTTVPAVVGDFKCIPVSERCFFVSWDAVLSAINYTANVPGETGLSVDVNNTLPGAEVCDVTTGSLYDISVFATNDAGDGIPGTIRGCYSVLSVPTGVTIRVDSQVCFTIEWDVIVEATSYTVRLTSDTAATREATSTLNSEQLCGLQAATVYRASVSATYTAGDSEFSTEDVSQITAPVTPKLEFAAATTDSITLSWNASDTATSYRVETSRVNPPSTDPATSQTTNHTTLTIPGLKPGTVYSFVAYSENAGGRSVASVPFEQITVPEAVQDLVVNTENVQKNVEFSWSSSVGASSYHLTVTQNGKEIQQEYVADTTWTGINVTNINDGESYNITVIAVTDARTVSLSSDPATKEFLTAPPTPINVEIKSIMTNEFDITWNISKSATLYEIRKVERNADGSDGATITENSTTLSRVITGLSAGTVYKVRVRARNDGGWSLESSEVIQITVPNAVTNLEVTRPVPQTSFRLLWNGVKGAASYDISMMDGTSPQTASVGVPTAEFKLQTPGTEYRVSVVARTSATEAGTQQMSEATKVVFKTAPENASAPMATDRSAISLTFNWTASDGADYYEVTALDSTGATALERNVTDLSTTLDGLISGTCYTIQITAVNSFGSSADISGEICTIPAPPDFNISSVTRNTISLNWDEQPGAIGYVLEARRTSDGNLVTLSTEMPIRGKEAHITGLEEGINYNLSLYTVGIRDNSDKMTKTQITVCAPPAVTLAKRTTDTLGYTWNAVTGADSYLVIYSAGSVSNNTPVTDASYDITGLNAGTVYSVIIRSINSAGYSDKALAHSTVISTGPAVTISDVTASGFQVSYTEVQDRENFVIQINPGEISVTATTLIETISDLSPGTTYSIVVIVNYRTVGHSAGSTPVNIITLTEAAANFAVASNTQNEGIRLSWDPAAGAAFYRVNFSRSDGVPATFTFNSSTGLIPTVLGLTYRFTIETINAAGDVGGVSTLNIQAESVKVITFEITMNSSFIFTNDLRDKTSMTFMNLRDYTAKVLTIILTDVHGFVRITIVEFVGASVVVRFNVDINEPATNADAIMAAYEASTEDKTAFSTDLSTNLNECLNVPNVCHAHADCTDNDASYTCACKIGYTGDGKATCTDVNECNSNPCHANAFCTNTLGTFSCTCKVGYQGTGVTCTDQDECETPGICGEIGTCKNTEGSYRCNCPAGYTDIGSDCVDDDECATNPCTGAHSICKNNPGRYTCECDTGYKSMSTSDDCIDVDECTETPTDCSVNQTCANTDGSYRCSCKPGYQAGGNDCHDMDECSLLSPCLESATCTNSVGSYICVCNDGFTGDGEVSCEDVNECDDNTTCSANETCANIIGSYTCSCAGGFSGTPNTQCLDIDECSDPDLCEPHGDCDNTVGSYFCVCDNGYVEDSGICVDKDECDANEIACSDRATCANTEGSYRCDCKKGYTGSNDICKDVDECTTELCPLNLTCINTEGSYTCNCGDGYTQTEDECRNINECVLGTENCPADRDCSDTDGNYKCNCKTGYTGTDCVGGQDCTACVNVNECDSGKENCNVNAVCTDTDGSFNCACKTYYTGDGFECTGDMTALYVEQGMNEKGRSNHMVTNLTSEVKTQVELQFRDFTFINVVFTNTSGTVIKATYSMQTARPIPLPVQLADYYISTVGDTNLFTTEPTLAENCGDKLSCAGGYCYEYNTDKRCGCNVGYNSSDSRCEDDDECGRNPCDEFANCANTPGSFTCTCKTGYTGDGTTCTDLDECSTTSFNCTANSACSNSIGSYMCTCNFGYTKTTDNTCKSQCEDFICQNGGTCVPSTTGDTPTCQCTSEYQGPKCGESSLYRNLAIAFGVIGGLLLIALIVAIVVYCVKRKSGGMDFVP